VENGKEDKKRKNKKGGEKNEKERV